MLYELKNPEIVSLLLEYGADLSQTRPRSQTTLNTLVYLALELSPFQNVQAELGHAETVQALHISNRMINFGADHRKKFVDHVTRKILEISEIYVDCFADDDSNMKDIGLFSIVAVKEK